MKTNLFDSSIPLKDRLAGILRRKAPPPKEYTIEDVHPLMRDLTDLPAMQHLKMARINLMIMARDFAGTEVANRANIILADLEISMAKIDYTQKQATDILDDIFNKHGK